MAVDRGTLDQQLQDIGESSRWWNLRELRDLPAVLQHDEHIVAVARGRVARIRWLRRIWLIVVTDDRLLCIRSARRKGWRQIDIGAAQISRVSMRVGPFKGRVIVTGDGQTWKLLVPRNDAYKLQAALMRLGPTGKEPLTGYGPTRVVRSMIDHVLAMPAAALAPATPVVPVVLQQPSGPSNDALLQRLNLLEDHVQRLTDQVEFLEGLLQERASLR